MLGAVPTAVVALVVASAVPVAIIVWAWRSMRQMLKAGPDVCRQCGYDLTASPDRCPECGATNEQQEEFRGLTRLREAWPEQQIQPRMPGAEETPEVVYEIENDWIVWRIKEHLEARGIHAEVREPVPIANTGRGEIFSPPAVVVWSLDAGRAREVINWLLAPNQENSGAGGSKRTMGS